METEGAIAGNTASLGITRCSYKHVGEEEVVDGGGGVGSVVIEC